MTQKTSTPISLPHPDLNIDRAQIAALGKAYDAAKAKGTAGDEVANPATKNASAPMPAPMPAPIDESMKRGLREMAAYLNMR